MALRELEYGIWFKSYSMLNSSVWVGTLNWKVQIMAKNKVDGQINVATVNKVEPLI